jgi:hypothetical protein
MSRIATNNWVHYSFTEIKEFRDSSTTNENGVEFMPNNKTYGLYFAVNNDWLQWCEYNQFRESDPNKYHKYVIENVNNLKIFDISKNNVDEYLDKDYFSDKLMVKIDFSKIKSEGYDGMYVPIEKISNLDMATAMKYCWSSYDVETLVVWNCTKLKLKESEKSEKKEKEELKNK